MLVLLVNGIKPQDNINSVQIILFSVAIIYTGCWSERKKEKLFTNNCICIYSDLFQSKSKKKYVINKIISRI